MSINIVTICAACFLAGIGLRSIVGRRRAEHDEPRRRQRGDLTGTGRERQSLHGFDAAVGLHEVEDLDGGVGHARSLESGHAVRAPAA